MWPILAYKAMLFLGFLTCVVFAYRLFREDEPHSVVDKFTFTKFFVIEKPHSGTVFVAMSLVCFVVMVTTKSEWTRYDDGSVSMDLAADDDEGEIRRVGETMVASVAPVDPVVTLEAQSSYEIHEIPQPVAASAPPHDPVVITPVRPEPERRAASHDRDQRRADFLREAERHRFRQIYDDDDSASDDDDSTR